MHIIHFVLCLFLSTSLGSVIVFDSYSDDQCIFKMIGNNPPIQLYYLPLLDRHPGIPPPIVDAFYGQLYPSDLFRYNIVNKTQFEVCENDVCTLYPIHQPGSQECVYVAPFAYGRFLELEGPVFMQMDRAGGPQEFSNAYCENYIDYQWYAIAYHPIINTATDNTTCASPPQKQIFWNGDDLISYCGFRLQPWDRPQNCPVDVTWPMQSCYNDRGCYCTKNVDCELIQDRPIGTYFRAGTLKIMQDNYVDSDKQKNKDTKGRPPPLLILVLFLINALLLF